MSSVKSKEAYSEEWISISDLMAGLMFLFLLVAVWFMSQVVEPWRTVREDIIDDLTREFQGEVIPWNIKIDTLNIAVRFQQPEVLFKAGEAELTPEFEDILSDFFPRYLGVLQPYQRWVRELRVEGHTSSDWKGKYGLEADIENMRLSQDRTFSVLTFLTEMFPVRQRWDDWLKARLTANGLGSSRTIQFEGTGLEDVSQSRRVEFRVEIDAGALLDFIIGEINTPPVAREAVS